MVLLLVLWRCDGVFFSLNYINPYFRNMLSLKYCAQEFFSVSQLLAPGVSSSEMSQLFVQRQQNVVEIH